MPKAIGIDVGGTNLRIGLFDGHVLLQETRVQADFSTFCKQHTATDAWHEILTTMAEAIEIVLTTYPDVQHIGIGFPGFINPKTSTIAQSPNLPGLIDVNLAQDLSRILNRMVVVENDANAAAFGEFCLFGQPQGGLLYLGLGTGVGGGLVLQGKVYAGQHGCAMEVGHMIVEAHGRACGCGNQGCMEQYASASGVALSYFNATQQKYTAAEIAQLARAGDVHAMHAYKVAANALAQALASILKVIDVQNIVIGGGMVGAWPLMAQDFHTRLNADLIPVLRGKVNIQISTAQDIAGMLGAAMLSVVPTTT
jgi:glucokinase